MKILAVMSELFYKEIDTYQTTLTSTNFIQQTFGKDNVVVVSPVTTDKVEGYSSKVADAKFEEVPHFHSIKNFLMNVIKNRVFLSSYIKRCNYIIDKYPDHIIWLRNPSIGSLVFGICATCKKRNIINHMCANAINGWRNDKYNFFEKIIGFVFSKILYAMIIFIAKNDKTLNLCTGDELFDMCYPHNKNSHQFVDVMLESPGAIKKNRIIQNEYYNFIFVGRVVLDKGIEDLCMAFKGLNIPNAELNIVGDGPALDYLKNKFFEDKKIKFYGQINNDKLSDFFIEATALVVPSKNSYEGFPRVIMESWLHHTPVIVYNTGGVKAFVKHNINGLIVKKDDIKELELALRRITNTMTYDTLCSGAYEASHISSFIYWSSHIKKILLDKFNAN